MLNYRLKGLFSWEIINPDGSVHDFEPVRHNLILTQGINAVASRSFVENMLYCAIGGGTTPPLLSDTSLSNETQRTGNVDGAVDLACSTLLSGNVYSLSKTFKFPANSYPITVGEIGWSWSSVAGSNLFSKALIIKNGVPASITLGVGQYLRVRYTLQITLAPSSTITGSANVIGWTVPSQYLMQYVGLRSINVDGSLSYYDSGMDCNEPSSTVGIFIGTNASALAIFGNNTDRSSGTNYTTNSSNSYLGGGRLIKSGSYGKGTAVNSSLRSMGIGTTSVPYTNSGFVVLFDTNQSKETDFILTTKFIYSWSS